MSAADSRCIVCDAALADAGRSYCSNACRQRAYRARQFASNRIDSSTIRNRAGPLPARRDIFVGRARELSRLRQAFQQHRLVTIAGSGGVGKTRLALEFVDQLPGTPTVFVELDTVNDRRLIAQAVATALRLREEPGRPITDSLAATLNKARAILFLDNCEHLVEPCAFFVDELLSRCPRLRVLATSREILNVTGEAVLQMDGLPVPDAGHDGTGAGLMRCDAVRLFVERARECAQDFDLTPANASHVAAVCADLDGNPLAIELAARCVPDLTVAAIHKRLTNRLDLLTTGRRTAWRRQRSLREAIEWSYELLAPAERTAFTRLSVLASPFDLDTATAVCADQELPATQVLGLVARLRATSLVASVPDSDHYRLLESIRLYGKEQLDARGETEATRDRLVNWLTKLAEPLVRQPFWFPMDVQRKLQGLSDNLHAAVRWTRDQDQYATLAIATARCWMSRGHVTEGRELVRSALERSTSRPDHRCVLLCYASYLAGMQGDLRAARAALREAGEVEGAVPVVTVQYTLGCLSLAGERLDAAAHHFTESLTLARTLEQPAAIAMALERLAWTELMRGEVDLAASLMRQALPAFHEPRAPHGLGLALHTAGSIALARDELDDAERHFRAALFAVDAHCVEVPFDLDGLGMVATRKNQPERAIRLFGAAASVRGAQLFAEPAWRRQVESSLSNIWRTLDKSDVAGVAADLDGLSVEETIVYALRDPETDRSQPAAPALDAEQRMVASLVLTGMSNREIAHRLDVSLRTVANRLRAIRETLGLSTRSDIATWAKNNQISPRD